MPTPLVGINVSNTVRPGTTSDAYPTFYANEGLGGFYQLSGSAGLSLIPSGRLQEGMLAWVSGSGATQGGQFFQYIGPAPSGSWVTASLNLSASYALTASYALNSTGGTTTGSFTGSFTGSLLGTASYALNALTASYILGGATVSTASYASFAVNGSGSWTGSFSGSYTGSLFGTSSYASTARIYSIFGGFF